MGRFLLCFPHYRYPFRRASERQKRAVWDKGEEIPNGDSKLWRRDTCGKLMKYSEHGNTDSKYGWEIDHIYPQAKGGASTIDNLQPLNWLTNRQKGDTFPYHCQ